jgi:predicted MFS family arabinose efflux permease
MTSPGGVIGEAVRWARRVVVEAAGGPARARVVLTLAAVLGLDGADTGTVGATENNLERVFHIGNTQIGLLLSAVSLAGVLFAIPMGVLVDRTNRVRLLTFSIVLWAVAVLFSGAAQSYVWLIAVRVALGVATATAAPAVASLTGDFFPASERGRIYGLIVGGDLIGVGIGFVISGDISSVLSWRFAFWWLILPSLALAWVVWRLPEPARGGQSQLQEGAEEISGAGAAAAAGSGAAGPGTASEGNAPGDESLDNIAVQEARREHVQPESALVLHSDPARRSVWWVIRYVLRVRTNVVLIIASALGYFYFKGLESFATIFAISRYGISKPEATLLLVVIGAGALVGVYAGGRTADRLLRRGHIRARIVVPMVCLLAIPVFFAPAFAVTSVAIAVPLLIAGAFLLGAPQPPVDAARLDIMPAQMWGRAEGVRTTLRGAAEAVAPTLFGYMSQYVFGGPASAGTGGLGGGSGAKLSPAAADGLAYTFMIFLLVLIIAGLLALWGLRTYPRDVATAAASAQAIKKAEEHDAEVGGRRAALIQPPGG